MTPWTQGGGTAPASNLGGGDDGKIGVNRLRRRHAVRGARPSVTRFIAPPGLKLRGGHQETGPATEMGEGRGARGDQDG
eukprot:scaffold39447_cov27-Phaeocystis_antarctica.AAC.1